MKVIRYKLNPRSFRPVDMEASVPRYGSKGGGLANFRLPEPVASFTIDMKDGSYRVEMTVTEARQFIGSLTQAIAGAERLHAAPVICAAPATPGPRFDDEASAVAYAQRREAEEGVQYIVRIVPDEAVCRWEVMPNPVGGC